MNAFVKHFSWISNYNFDTVQKPNLHTSVIFKKIKSQIKSHEWTGNEKGFTYRDAGFTYRDAIIVANEA